MKTYEELTADGWQHMVNAGNEEAAEVTIVALRMVHDSLEYLIGEPKEAALPAQELSKRGIVGIYQRSGKANPLQAYPVIFPDGYVSPKTPWVNPDKRRWISTDIPDYTPTLSCAG